MPQHTKQYKRYGEGVELLCGKKAIAESPWRFTNFSVTSCLYCGAEVATIGHSPDTDKVQESFRD